MIKPCTKCGRVFTAAPTGGRPRARCDTCRSNHDRNDGKSWRSMRARVLAEEPICYFAGCGRRSTQVDHLIPLKLRPDLGLERSNLRGICATHNASKGARLIVGTRAPALAFFDDDDPPPSPRCNCGDPTCPGGRWHL